jgi:hypothetical protein
LRPFNSTPDQSFTMGKVHLVPVKNISVVLKNLRHFVISSVHPKGQEVFLAINKGLTILRKQDVSVKTYQQAGFLSILTDIVKIINP